MDIKIDNESELVRHLFKIYTTVKKGNHRYGNKHRHWGPLCLESKLDKTIPKCLEKQIFSDVRYISKLLIDNELDDVLQGVTNGMLMRYLNLFLKEPNKLDSETREAYSPILEDSLWSIFFNSIDIKSDSREVISHTLNNLYIKEQLIYLELLYKSHDSNIKMRVYRPR